MNYIKIITEVYVLLSLFTRIKNTLAFGKEMTNVFENVVEIDF